MYVCDYNNKASILYIYIHTYVHYVIHGSTAYIRIYSPLCIVHFLCKPQECTHGVRSRGQDEHQRGCVVDVLVEGWEVNGRTLDKQRTKILHDKGRHSRCHLRTYKKEETKISIKVIQLWSSKQGALE